MTLWKITIRGRDDKGAYEFSVDIEDATAEGARRTAELGLESGERVIRVMKAPNPNTGRFRRKP